ncbi:MAG: hypothetical protein ACOX8R_04485 [Bacillota bacterium]
MRKSLQKGCLTWSFAAGNGSAPSNKANECFSPERRRMVGFFCRAEKAPAEKRLRDTRLFGSFLTPVFLFPGKEPGIVPRIEKKSHAF